MRPSILLKWPGCVPIFPKCERCDGRGHKVHNAETRHSTSADGMTLCEELFGDIFMCVHCSGWGYLTRYGNRGQSFTPLVARRKTFRDWFRMKESA